MREKLRLICWSGILFLSVLFIPSVPTRAQDQWRLRIGVRPIPITEGIPDFDNFIGTDPQAKDGPDLTFDFLDPPALAGGYVVLGILHPSSEKEWVGAEGIYATDIRSPIPPGATKTWVLVVTTDLGTQEKPVHIELFFTPLGDLPSNLKFTLLDPEDANQDGIRSYDLKRMPSLVYQVSAGGTPSQRRFEVEVRYLPPTPLPGDLNKDGTINLSDAVLALRFAGGLAQPSAEQILAGDVAPKIGGKIGDGRITILDVLRILRRSLGLEPDPWP